MSSICSEDVHPDAGPLQYVPGSHLIEPWRNVDGTTNVRTADEFAEASSYYAAEVDRRGLTTETFCGRAGDVFLWHGQLLHGGSPIRDMRLTRRSIVSHYWSRACHGGHPDVRQSNSAYYDARDHQDVP